MQKRFQATTILINREHLHTIIDRDSGPYCAVTYKYEIDAILEADFLNSAHAIIEVRTAKEQREGRAKACTCGAVHFDADHDGNLRHDEQCASH